MYYLYIELLLLLLLQLLLMLVIYVLYLCCRLLLMTAFFLLNLLFYNRSELQFLIQRSLLPLPLLVLFVAAAEQAVAVVEEEDEFLCGRVLPQHDYQSSLLLLLLLLWWWWCVCMCVILLLCPETMLILKIMSTERMSQRAQTCPILAVDVDCLNLLYTPFIFLAIDRLLPVKLAGARPQNVTPYLDKTQILPERKVVLLY